MGYVRAGIIFILSFQFSFSTFAANLDLPAEDRPQIRSRIVNCETMLVPGDQNSDSVGIPYSTNSPAEFERELRADLELYGEQRFAGATFYILGTAMQKEAKTEEEFEAVVRRLDLDKVGLKIKVLSVPARLVHDKSVSLAQHMLQRLKYFLPSRKRDLQQPQWREVTNNWLATAAVEAVNVGFLYKGMPAAQATLVAVTLGATLLAYTIYIQSMTNFLLRHGSENKWDNQGELFVKQMLLSLPFVLNYNVFGNLSQILNFYAKWGWDKTLAAFPYELAHFTTTQFLTLFLQTVFYAQVVTQGYGGWVEGQVGVDNSRDARSLRPLLQIPILATDSLLLMIASSNYLQPIFSIGPFDFNYGHAGLIALTGVMVLWFKKFPQGFNAILRQYQKRKKNKKVVAPTGDQAA